MKTVFLVSVLLCICMVFVLIGCGIDESETGNLAPVITVFEVDSEVVYPGTEVSIQLRSADLNNDPLTYTWSASHGAITGDETGAIWNAPDEEIKSQIQVTVSDGVKSTTSTLDIQVWRGRDGNYYPLAVGNIWRYRGGDDTLVTFEIIDTIQIELEDGNTTESFVLQKTNSGKDLENIVNYSYLGKETDASGEITAIIQHAQNTTSGTEDTIVFEPYLPLYQFPLFPGKKWEVSYIARLVDETLPIILGGGIDEFEVRFENSVTVPAGTFNDVFEVEESFQWSLRSEVDNFDIDLTVAKKWVAPDVGIIKFTQEQTRGGLTVVTLYELESYELKNN